MKSRIVKFLIETNAIQDAGDGMVKFTKPIAITDNKEQWNGTKYDINSMDVSAYRGHLTANHSMEIQDIIGKVTGLSKNNVNVTIDGVQFAINENPLALFAYNMMLGGFLTDFSIETIGPWPNEEGIYKDSQLVGLSAVVVGNNKKAHVNEIAVNSMQQAKAAGMDVTLFKNWGLDTDSKIHNTIDEDMKFAKITNNRDFAVTLNYKDVDGEDAKITLQPNDSFKVEESQKNAAEEIIKNAVAPVKETPKVEPEKTEPAKTDNAVLDAVKALAAKVEEMEKTAFNKNASEPGFKEGQKFNVNTGAGDTDFAAMDYRERAGKQINLAWELLKDKRAEAGVKLDAINKFHFDELKKAGLAKNVLSMTDLGNFVISPELLKDIEGVRSDFSPIFGPFSFTDTLSLQMAWLKRSGDIAMTEISMDPDADGVNASLKPVSEYAATFNTSNLKELAAVTPVCDSATRFLAVDLLGDVAAGYREDYDRKRAQLIIARLQQAVNTSGQKNAYVRTTAVTGLTSWIPLWATVRDLVGDNGVFVFNTATKAQLLIDAVSAGFTAASAQVMTTGDFTPLLGRPAVVVPNELMPSLNTGGTKSFTVEGATVTINQAVFYADARTFAGRTSGGLKYDFSTEAAYETGGSVRSAFQRNELVLRGSFFRGGAIKDTSKVASLGAAGIS
jgi:hypothetical protein